MANYVKFVQNEFRQISSLYPNQTESVEIYDNTLHQMITNIYRERCNSGGSQTKEHFRNESSIIKPILERHPVLSRQLQYGKSKKLSLLWISVLAGYEKSAELLMRSGADVNELLECQNPQMIDEKWTILHMLLQMTPSPMNERLIRLVTDHGADLHARDRKGGTPLHYAVSKGQVQMTEMLLEKGADVNVADDEGMTPLLIAMTDSKLANGLVPLLMKHGADVFAKYENGDNVLHSLALFRPQDNAVLEMARVFIEKGVSLDDRAGPIMHQPIHAAVAWGGSDELVKLYLDYGANANALTIVGESALNIAAQLGRSAVIKTLLKGGANIDLKSTGPFGGRTALHVACERAAWNIPTNSECVIRLLLFSGADVLAENSDGNTPLALISSHGNMERLGIWPIIKMLALKKALQPTIELKDERIIGQSLQLRQYFRDCTNEIDRMKSARFFHTCTFFELLVKNHCQIAVRMRNPEFKTKFNQCDLSRFSIYAEDLRQAFNRALNLYPSMLKQVDVIIEAFYNILPHLVVDKIVNYIFD